MLFENVNALCKKHGTALYKLEKELGFGNGALYKWAEQTPSVDRVKAVADYFGVTVDALLADDASASDRDGGRG